MEDDTARGGQPTPSFDGLEHEKAVRAGAAGLWDVDAPLGATGRHHV